MDNIQKWTPITSVSFLWEKRVHILKIFIKSFQGDTISRPGHINYSLLNGFRVKIYVERVSKIIQANIIWMLRKKAIQFTSYFLHIGVTIKTDFCQRNLSSESRQFKFDIHLAFKNSKGNILGNAKTFYFSLCYEQGQN